MQEYNNKLMYIKIFSCFKSCKLTIQESFWLEWMLDEADDQTWQDVDPGGDQCFDVVLEVPDDTQRCGYHQQNQRHNREYCRHSVGTYKMQRQRLTRIAESQYWYLLRARPRLTKVAENEFIYVSKELL